MKATPERLRQDALTCRELAETAITPSARDVLKDLALMYERKAEAMQHLPAARASPSAFVWAYP